MQNKFQVVIAGAGPGGTLLARDLARQGVRVAVYEAGGAEELGHNWSDAVEKSALSEAGFELPVLEEGCYRGTLVKKDEFDDNLFEPHAVSHLEIWTPDLSGKTRTDVDFRYITTDRMQLNRMLREQAVTAGARIFYRHRVEGLLGTVDTPLEEIRVEGLRVADLEKGQALEIRADVSVDASGYRSLLRTGLSGAFSINRVFEKGDLATVYRTVRRLDTGKTANDNLIDHYRYGAYTGYFWTHRHHPDSIDVGGGVRKSPDSIDPRDIVEEMIRQRPSITGEKLRGGGGTVLVSRSPYTMTASGFVAVGDAAGQVIPTTGCGVGGAMTGAMLAAGVIAEALQAGDAGIGNLWSYNKRWFCGPGRGDHFAALAGLKEVLQSLSHEDLTFLMQRDILSGEMLTPSINGIFYQPDLVTSLKTLVRGISRPGLLMLLNKATGMGKKIFRHYRSYPETWNADVFRRWVRTAEELFGKLGNK